MFFGTTADLRSWRIVLKKSFLGDERNFSGPLTRFARGDVRDHIVSHKNGRRPLVSPPRALQRSMATNQLSRDFRCSSIFDFFNTSGFIECALHCVFQKKRQWI
jgi:hypothetical protein